MSEIHPNSFIIVPLLWFCPSGLTQFNRGVSAMQRYVASRPMFMDVEIMELDAKTVLRDPSNVAKGLNILYKEILGLFLLFTMANSHPHLHGSFGFTFLCLSRNHEIEAALMFRWNESVLNVQYNHVCRYCAA